MMDAATRDKEIICAALYSDMSLRKIGRQYGLSHERIRQILKRKSDETGIPIICNWRRLDSKATTSCHVCGKEFLRYKSVIRRNGKNFCSMDCYKSGWGFVEVTCDGCGQPFKKRRGFVNRKDERYKGRNYCTRRCFYDSNWENIKGERSR